MNQKGRSLHIGLNHVDTAAYQASGWTIPDLSGCINDATAMQMLAANQGFITQILTDERAISSEVIRLIASYANELESGDIFFLTFSGHGGQEPDVNGDEDDGLDETWVLWDRMLIDDELFSMFGQFRPNVRIIMLSDSCHSGTVARMVMYKAIHEQYRQMARILNNPNAVAERMGMPVRDIMKANGDQSASREIRALERAVREPTVRFRGINTTISNDIYNQKKATYDTLQYLSGRRKSVGIDASLILISGCQDHQLSQDGDNNGLFTGTLLDVWNKGAFTGSYSDLWRLITDRMPPTQTPNLFTLGNVSSLTSEHPFTVVTQQFNPTSNLDPRMTVVGNSSRSRNGGAPDFNIDTQGAPYYVTEFVTDISLFDYNKHGGERSTGNFWASWSESPLHSATYSFYPMPNSAWNALKHAGLIYFRVGTTTSTTGYENYRVSTLDGAMDGPYISLID